MGTWSFASKLLVVFSLCILLLFSSSLIDKHCISGSQTYSFFSSASSVDLWNQQKIWTNEKLRLKFEELNQQQVKATDPNLIQFVGRLFDPPSDHHIRKPTHSLFQTPQAAFVDEYYKQKRNLFFVEAGALDGERSSNTLWLEVKRDWKGLLVEADPYFYTQLRGKARRAYTINACLSGKVQKLSFHDTPGGRGHVSSKSSLEVPCFPIYTLLAALNTTHVDYFSLDIEGHELEVLDALPWDKLHIQVINIEYPPLEGYARTKAIESLKDYMRIRGYTPVKQFDEKIPVRDLWNRDILFVKNATK